MMTGNSGSSPLGGLSQGTFTSNGTFAVDTGKFTGRSPKDKWLVKQGDSAKNIWYGAVIIIIIIINIIIVRTANHVLTAMCRGTWAKLWNL
jgi:ATP-dependent phosphoenolpyruvate carboxykinase